MGNIRHISFRRLWLFAGCLALLLALKSGRSQTRPASSTHTTPAQEGNGNNHEGSK